LSAAEAASADAWATAVAAAALFAADPSTGIRLRAQPGPVRERWLAVLATLMPGVRFRRLPLHADEDRLFGGLDLTATLSAGRPVVDPGFLAEAHGGVVLLPMAERLPRTTAARLSAVLDTGEVPPPQGTPGAGAPARFGLVALDEGLDAEEAPPEALSDRLALWVDLNGIPPRAPRAANAEAGPVADMRAQLAGVDAADEVVAAIASSAAGLGIASLRAPHLALRVSRAAAALAGRRAVAAEDAALAARLVLAPRATTIPATHEEEADAAPEHAAQPDRVGEGETPERGDGKLEDMLIAATLAALPPDVLARIKAGHRLRRSGAAGGGGEKLAAQHRGRPVGNRRGRPGGGARLDIVATLRAAAPLQPLRRRVGPDLQAAARIELRRDDFRVRRFRRRTETTAIFVVDASGSSAFHRLAEAKGAVELILADCYVRRDSVALIAFRGRGAELLLPPTRSLARAKRNLAELPGGGPTPLAAGIDAAAMLASGVRRSGRTPAVVLLTDGRANMTRDGTAERPRAMAEAIAAAQSLRAAGVAAILIDTAPKPREEARRVAAAMQAHYLALPQAGAAPLSHAVRAHVDQARQAPAPAFRRGS